MPVDQSTSRNAENNSEKNDIMTDANQGNQQINKITLRAPPFWPDEPELWFAQIESQFILSGITQDSTKYAHILSQLDAKFAKEIKDVIINPPKEEKYAAVKNALIQRVSASQEERTRQLLEHEELGDRKPSQFLRHLRTLAGVSVPDHLLRTLWLGRLPSHMRMILATRSQDRLEEVAEQADRIMEVSGRSVSEIATSSNNSNLIEMINKLTLQIAEINKKNQTRWQPQRRARSRSRDKRSSDNICYFHRRFGNEAKKCNKPCKYQAPKEQGSH